MDALDRGLLFLMNARWSLCNLVIRRWQRSSVPFSIGDPMLSIPLMPRSHFIGILCRFGFFSIHSPLLRIPPPLCDPLSKTKSNGETHDEYHAQRHTNSDADLCALGHRATAMLGDVLIASECGSATCVVVRFHLEREVVWAFPDTSVKVGAGVGWIRRVDGKGAVDDTERGQINAELENKSWNDSQECMTRKIYSLVERATNIEIASHVV